MYAFQGFKCDESRYQIDIDDYIFNDIQQTDEPCFCLNWDDSFITISITLYRYIVAYE